MPRSKNFFPDVNVWLALASGRHVHHESAARWMDGVSGLQVAFCRVTQMGLLRLLTNRHAMGADVITQAKAWEVYDRIHVDSRVHFLIEPVGIEPVWRRFAKMPQAAPNLWTDAYLQAFAYLKELCLVSFDKGFLRTSGVDTLVLP